MTVSTTPELMTERERYIDGLRVLATALELNPELDLPVGGSVLPLSFNFWGDDARERLAAARRSIPCEWRKQVTEEGDKYPAYFHLNGQLGGLKLQLSAYRNKVCERRVVGTEDREVDEVVTPAVTKKVMKPVDVVEWDCGPLLAPRPAVADKAPDALLTVTAALDA